MIEYIGLFILILISIFLITKGSDWMTDSLIPVAEWLGTSYIAVATLLVSVMLSIPEVIISLYAFYAGHSGISLGVIIGSIICNICLMTGLSAMIRPLSVDRRVIVRDGIFAAIITIIVFIFGFDLSYGRGEGIILMLLFIPYALNVWFFEKWESKIDKDKELNEIKGRLKVIGLGWFKFKPGVFSFIAGSIFLLSGSYMFAESLITLTKTTGISDIIIGLTIGAIGPSIPNIISAVNGTIKNYTKIAITETFSSDIFTLLITLGLLATISPFAIDKRWLYFDIPIMLFMTFLMMFFILKGKIKEEHAIERHEGAILVLLYVIFIVANVIYYTIK